MRYEIQIKVAVGWEAYQSLNATNDRAAAKCYAEWLLTITHTGRGHFRLVKVFSNPA